MNKTFIRGLLDQRGHGSLLPLGDNWPTHIGQDGSERRELGGGKKKTHGHTPTHDSLYPPASYFLTTHTLGAVNHLSNDLVISVTKQKPREGS